MAGRLNWVPTHSIIVVRDGKQIDAFEATDRGTKAFKFTSDEVDEIVGMSPDALRVPVEETVEVSDDEVKAIAETKPVPAAAQPAVVKPAVAAKDVKL